MGMFDVLTDAWNGSDKMWGKLVGTPVDMLGEIPEVGKIIKAGVGDGKSAAGFVDAVTGADKEKPGEATGNVGNKIGTLLGGALGLIGGPGGVALGSALGSTAGGWLAGMLGAGDTEAQRARKEPELPLGLMDPHAIPGGIGAGFQQHPGGGGGLLDGLGGGGLGPVGPWNPGGIGAGYQEQRGGYAQAGGSSGGELGPLGPWNPTPGLGGLGAGLGPVGPWTR